MGLAPSREDGGSSGLGCGCQKFNFEHVHRTSESGRGGWGGWEHGEPRTSQNWRTPIGSAGGEAIFKARRWGGIVKELSDAEEEKRGCRDLGDDPCPRAFIRVFSVQDNSHKIRATGFNFFNILNLGERTNAHEKDTLDKNDVEDTCLLGAKTYVTCSYSCGSCCCTGRWTHHYNTAGGLAVVPPVYESLGFDCSLWDMICNIVSPSWCGVNIHCLSVVNFFCIFSSGFCLRLFF